MNETLTNAFPLLKGKTGVEVLTRTVPVVLRLYKGPLRVLTHRTKTKCRIEGNVAKIATRAITFPYKNLDTVTRVTLAFDYPLIDRIESTLPDTTIEGLGKSGEIIFTPNPENGCLLILSSV